MWGPCQDLSNVSIMIEDATKLAQLNKHQSFFDIFVDDGSHISEDIVATFDSCWSWVKPSGFYIIEDLSCTYKEEYTQTFRNTFGRDVQNKRETFLILVDALMKHCDAKKGSIESMEYHPQLLIIRKSWIILIENLYFYRMNAFFLKSCILSHINWHILLPAKRNNIGRYN